MLKYLVPSSEKLKQKNIFLRISFSKAIDVESILKVKAFCIISAANGVNHVSRLPHYILVFETGKA